MRQFLITSCLVLLSTSPALAWSEAGHRIIASIAFRQLTPVEQQRVLRILSHHPRFREDFDRQLPDEFRGEGDAVIQAEWMLQQASIWPDKVRAFQGDLREEFHHPTWHYINVPQFLTDADKTAMESTLKLNLATTKPAGPVNELNIVQTIKLARSVLADDRASDTEKALMLAWLCHTVGDIHQPLHATAMFSRKLFPDGDRGGNLVQTTQRGNLHSLWDQLPADRMDFKAARDRGVELIHHQTLSPIGKRAAERLDEKVWLDESFRHAVNEVYTAEVLGHLRQFDAAANSEPIKPITLSEEYLKAGGEVCVRRVVEAGYRLGAVLKQIAD